MMASILQMDNDRVNAVFRNPSVALYQGVLAGRFVLRIGLGLDAALELDPGIIQVLGRPAPAIQHPALDAALFDDPALVIDLFDTDLVKGDTGALFGDQMRNFEALGEKDMAYRFMRR